MREDTALKGVFLSVGFVGFALFLCQSSDCVTYVK